MATYDKNKNIKATDKNFENLRVAINKLLTNTNRKNPIGT